MNLETKKLKSNEIEINISSLVEQCLRKIKLIAIVGIIFAVLLCGLVYLSDLEKYKEATNLQNNENIIEIDENTYAIQNYILLEQKLKQLEEYKEDSVYFKLDFNDVSQSKVTFYVDAQESVKTDIANSIKNYINNGSLASKLSKTENFPEEKYIQELISAEVVISGEQSSTGIITIQILSVDAEMNQVFTTAIVDAILEYSNSLKNSLAEHTLTVLSKDDMSMYMGDVYIAQKSVLQEYENVKVEFNTHISTMSQEELAFVKNITKNENLSSNEQIEIVVEAPTISFKYAFLGFVCGVVFTVLFICVKVLFSGKIQTDKELLHRLNISHLGTVSNSKYLDRLLYKSDYSIETQKELILSKLKMKMQNVKDGKVVLASTTKIVDYKEVLELTDVLKDTGIECVVIENVLENISLLENTMDSMNIVLVETIAKSDIKKIYEASMLWMELKANMLGYIVVKR